LIQRGCHDGLLMNKELQLALNSFSRIEAALTCAMMCGKAESPVLPKAMLKKLVTDIKMTRKAITDKLSEETEIEMEDAYA